MKLSVLDTNGMKVDELEVSAAVFAAPIREHAIWEVVKWQRAKRRAGTHSTKTRTLVRGGGKKPYRQKGTGNARQGSSRAPNHVGGGKVFGPKPRAHGYRINRQTREAALRAVLSLRAREARLLIVRDFSAPTKTKAIVEILGRLSAPKALVVDAAANRSLALSMRNLQDARFLAREGFNVYDVLNYEALILTESTARHLDEVLNGPSERKTHG